MINVHVAVVLAVAGLCALLAGALARMAFARLGVARVVLRARGGGPRPGREGEPARFTGAVSAVGAPVRAPFSQREAVWVRARLRGAGPEGGAPKVLWEKVLHCRARLRGGRAATGAEFDPGAAGTLVLVPREYRQGTLRALLPASPVVARALSRAGYAAPPPPDRFFELEEEVLAVGDEASVVGRAGASGELSPATGGPVVAYNVNRWRVVLRTAWGPALALFLALIITATGATVLGVWWWLR